MAGTYVKQRYKPRLQLWLAPLHDDAQDKPSS